MNLGKLRNQFLTCIPIKDIIWTKDIATESTQQDVIAATIRNEVLKGKPLPNSYTTHFMKTFMAKIEEFGGEIYDVTFEAYGDMLTLPSTEITYRHYSVNDKVISLQETDTLVAEGTTGLHTWQASQYLAEYLIDNSILLENKNVLELGCGVGFLGLSLCSVSKCSSYILSDHHVSVLRKLQANITINNGEMTCRPTVEDIDWEHVATNGFNSSQLSAISNVDVILAADVVYDVDIIPSLTATIKSALSTGSGKSAFIASTVRNENTYSAFIENLGKEGLGTRTITSNSEKLFIYDETSPISIICVTNEDH